MLVFAAIDFSADYVHKLTINNWNINSILRNWFGVYHHVGIQVAKLIKPQDSPPTPAPTSLTVNQGNVFLRKIEKMLEHEKDTYVIIRCVPTQHPCHSATVSGGHHSVRVSIPPFWGLLNYLGNFPFILIRNHQRECKEREMVEKHCPWRRTRQGLQSLSDSATYSCEILVIILISHGSSLVKWG